jgi:hypothetical protein
LWRVLHQAKRLTSDFGLIVRHYSPVVTIATHEL